MMVYSQKDIQRMLISVHTSMLTTLECNPTQDPGATEIYRQGFESAIRAIAISFGVGETRGPVYEGRVTKYYDILG